jgi:hypothetical protein
MLLPTRLITIIAKKMERVYYIKVDILELVAKPVTKIMVQGKAGSFVR